MLKLNIKSALFWMFLVMLFLLLKLLVYSIKEGVIMKKLILAIFMLLTLGITIVACDPSTESKEIRFADADWDSIKFHNAVAGTIAKELFGYTYTEVPGSTTVLHEGLIKGEIDVHMEIWADNIASYNADLEAGKFLELSTNFDDNYQGFYVPRYVIEGDEERDIEPLAPDLKYVADLKDYADVFVDVDNPDKGRVYGSIPGWEVDEIMHNKFEHYKLDENFMYFRPGSQASLSTAITSAYEKGEPIVAYYWEPTWLLGKYDMVLLDDEPYNPDTYLEGKTALPAVAVNVGVSNKFAEGNEKVVDFLKKYKTSSALTSKALAYMQDTDADYEEAARWFLNEHSELVDEWLDADDARALKELVK